MRQRVSFTRVRGQSLSSGTGAYIGGRKRLTMQVAEWFTNEVSDSIIATAPLTVIGPASERRRVFVVDGTTITLAPVRALQAAFHPSSNQHGEGVWPVMLLVVAHELPRACFARLPARSVVLGDGNFGIFSVSHSAIQCEHSLLLRMTEPRSTRCANGTSA